MATLVLALLVAVVVMCMCMLRFCMSRACHECTPLGQLPYGCALVPLKTITRTRAPSGVVVGIPVLVN